MIQVDIKGFGTATLENDRWRSASAILARMLNLLLNSHFMDISPARANWERAVVERTLEVLRGEIVKDESVAETRDGRVY